jgi:hypothetical protein
MELKKRRERRPFLTDHRSDIKLTNIFYCNKIMSENEALRATIMQETNGLGDRRRFGLFSSPISTAIGDDGEYKTKLRIYQVR